jgi:hypothetical protein
LVSLGFNLPFLIFFVFLSFSFFNKSFADFIESDSIYVSSDEIEAYDAVFLINGVNGKSKKIKANKEVNRYFLENAEFSIEDWIVEFALGDISKDDNYFEQISATSTNGAHLRAGFLLYKEKALMLGEIFITPCKNSKFCWAWKASSAKKVGDRVVLKKNKIFIGKLGIPIGNISYPIKPASGFLPIRLSRSYLDGFALKLPYYFRFSKKSDLTLSTFLGASVGADSYFRSKTNKGFLFESFLGFKKGFSDDVKSGLYFDMKSKPFAQKSSFDFNVSFFSSSIYAKYWDRKMNQKRRSIIPGYFYYTPNSKVRLGWNQFINTDDGNNYKIFPSLTFEDFVFKKWGSLEYGVGLNGFSNIKPNSKFEDSNLLGSVFASVSSKNIQFHGFSNQSKLGFKGKYSNLEKKSLPFFINKTSFSSFAFKNSFNSPFFEFKLMPKYQGQSFAANNLSESLESNNSYSAFMLGINSIFSNYSLDVGFQKRLFNKTLPSNFFMINLDTKWKKFAFACSNYFGKHNELSFSGVLSLKKVNLSSVFSSTFYDKKPHDYLIFSATYDFSSKLKSELGSSYRTRPDSKFVNSFLKFVYTSKCWKFSLGIAYDVDSLYLKNKKAKMNTNPKTILTGSISINGAQNFSRLSNAMKKWASI